MMTDAKRNGEVAEEGRDRSTDDAGGGRDLGEEQERGEHPHPDEGEGDGGHSCKDRG